MPNSPEKRITNQKTEEEGSEKQEVPERRQELINEMLKLPTAYDFMKQWEGLVSKDEESLLWAVYSNLFNGDFEHIFFDKKREAIEEKNDKLRSCTLRQQLQDMGISVDLEIIKKDEYYTIRVIANNKIKPINR